jgi:uncharacterized pyridoxamine 5'-phosphate oxidase family protein
MGRDKIKAVKFLKDAGKFFVATVEGDKPKIRPFGAVSLFENRIYFSTASSKNVFAQLQKNPSISICACGDGREWVRIEATAKFDQSPNAKQFMIADNPALKSRADEVAFVVFYLENETIEFQ